VNTHARIVVLELEWPSCRQKNGLPDVLVGSTAGGNCHGIVLLGLGSSPSE
jgi:hypothetical protein